MTNPNFRIYSFIYQKFLLAQGSVLNSMYRSGLVYTLVNHGNMKGLGLTPLFGDRCGFMPPLLKQNKNKTENPSRVRIKQGIRAQSATRGSVAIQLSAIRVYFAARCCCRDSGYNLRNLFVCVSPLLGPFFKHTYFVLKYDNCCAQ